MAAKADVDRIIEKMKALGYTRGVGNVRAPSERFANDREEKVFRAVAGNYPKAVLVRHDTPKAFKKAADDLVKVGSLNCVILSDGPAYKLTAAGKRRAIAEKIL